MSNFMHSEELKVEKIFYRDIDNIVIPVYQRPYRWEKEQCEQLWNDVLAISEDDNNPVHFLGSIVAYKNKNSLEIIDGQQRITTITLFLRALLEFVKNSDDSEVNKYKRRISTCIFKINDADEINYGQPILKSEVALEDDINEFHNILGYKDNEKKQLEGNFKSNYGKNCQFFYNNLKEESKNNSIDFAKNFKKIFLNLIEKCIVLKVVCENQESAMRIFNTLNNRGMPLSSSDILKGMILQNQKSNEEKIKIIAQTWKNLEKLSKNNKGGVDFLFLQYLFIIKAKNKDDDSSVSATLKFFSQDTGFSKSEKKYNSAPKELLLNENTMITLTFLEKLVNFWNDPYAVLSDDVKPYFMVLENYMNEYWKMAISTMLYKKLNNINLDFIEKEPITDLIYKLLAFVLISFLNGRGTTSGLKIQLFKTNIQILNNENEDENISFLTHREMKFPTQEEFAEFSKNQTNRNIKFLLMLNSILAAKEENEEQNIFHLRNKNKEISLSQTQVEHIFPRSWDKQNSNTDLSPEEKENIGNKILLETYLNIKASDKWFGSKKDEYKKSSIIETRKIGGDQEITDWGIQQIETRNKEIYKRLLKFCNTYYV